jgi:hypothetical protein
MSKITEGVVMELDGKEYFVPAGSSVNLVRTTPEHTPPT